MLGRRHWRAAVSRCLLPVSLARWPRPRVPLSAPSSRVPPQKIWQENPFREFKQVEEVLSATQREHDERMVLSDRPFIPFNLCVVRESRLASEAGLAEPATFHALPPPPPFPSSTAGEKTGLGTTDRRRGGGVAKSERALVH